MKKKKGWGCTNVLEISVRGDWGGGRWGPECGCTRVCRRRRLLQKLRELKMLASLWGSRVYRADRVGVGGELLFFIRFGFSTYIHFPLLAYSFFPLSPIPWFSPRRTRAAAWADIRVYVRAQNIYAIETKVSSNTYVWTEKEKLYQKNENGSRKYGTSP